MSENGRASKEETSPTRRSANATKKFTGRRKGQAGKCGNCGQTGHYKSRCKLIFVEKKEKKKTDSKKRTSSSSSSSSAAAASTDEVPVEELSGEALVGMRVAVFGAAEGTKFEGTVIAFDPSKSAGAVGEYVVKYDDGEIEFESRADLEILANPKQTRLPKKARTGTAPAQAQSAPLRFTASALPKKGQKEAAANQPGTLLALWSKGAAGDDGAAGAAGAAATVAAPAEPLSVSTSDLPAGNDSEKCVVCGSAERRDKLLRCNGCQSVFHFKKCIEVPLAEVAKDGFYCDVCRAARHTARNVVVSKADYDVSASDAAISDRRRACKYCGLRTHHAKACSSRTAWSPPEMDYAAFDSEDWLPSPLADNEAPTQPGQFAFQSFELAESPFIPQLHSPALPILVDSSTLKLAPLSGAAFPLSEESYVLNVGGLARCVAWSCSRHELVNSDSTEVRYLAVAPHRVAVSQRDQASNQASETSPFHITGIIYSSANSVQVWRFVQHKAPSLMCCIPYDGDSSEALAWCPHSSAQGVRPRAGLLCLGSADGRLRVFSVPLLAEPSASEAARQTFPLVQCKPVFEYATRRPSSPVSVVDWSHPNLLLAGTHDGRILAFSISQSCGSNEDQSKTSVSMFSSFTAHPGAPVTGLSTSPYEMHRRSLPSAESGISRYFGPVPFVVISCAAIDRPVTMSNRGATSTMRMWDLRNTVALPVIEFPSRHAPSCLGCVWLGSRDPSVAPSADIIVSDCLPLVACEDGHIRSANIRSYVEANDQAIELFLHACQIDEMGAEASMTDLESITFSKEPLTTLKVHSKAPVLNYASLSRGKSAELPAALLTIDSIFSSFGMQVATGTSDGAVYTWPPLPNNKRRPNRVLQFLPGSKPVDGSDESPFEVYIADDDAADKERLSAASYIPSLAAPFPNTAVSIYSVSLSLSSDGSTVLAAAGTGSGLVFIFPL